jgi:hypothetical protein
MNPGSATKSATKKLPGILLPAARGDHRWKVDHSPPAADLQLEREHGFAEHGPLEGRVLVDRILVLGGMRHEPEDVLARSATPRERNSRSSQIVGPPTRQPQALAVLPELY